MELGINPIVDDISADHLNKLRNDLGLHLLLELGADADADPTVVAGLIDDFMKLAAEQMHDACSDAYHAGEHAATDVVPDVSLDDWDSNPVIDTVEDDLRDSGAETREQAAALLPELEARLGALTDRERSAVLDRFDA